jgi:hypothetical protein
LSRSIKKGIDYFSLDVGLFSDRKVRRLMRSCGAAAVSVLVKVWCGAYDENGYFICADDDLYFDISAELGLSEDFVREAVQKSIEASLFDSALFERFGILTSRRMQRNYLDATKRRGNAQINSEYLLIPGDIADSGSHSADSCMQYVCEGTQSKVKQIKEEERREEEITPKQGAHKQRAGEGGCFLTFGDNVSMTEEEYGALREEYGENAAKRMTEMLGNYKASKGKEYASDYRAILSWVVKRYKEEQGSRGPSGGDYKTDIESESRYSEVV